ncbi:hypothetical protein [Bradyrhizobium sp.]
MPRLYRPHIPISVRCQVAERQFHARFPNGHQPYDLLKLDWTLARRLKWLLFMLFGDGAKTELHHRPALVNRPWNPRRKDYDPPANSPEHLFYLLEGDHDVETRIRGIGAQRSDLSQARYLKKVARNREARPKASKFPKQTSQVKHSTKIPSRKWPKRKFERRAP